MKETLRKSFEPFVGLILAGAISIETFQNIILSTVIAFMGGIAAWFARRICEHFYKKIYGEKPVKKTISKKNGKSN